MTNAVRGTGRLIEFLGRRSKIFHKVDRRYQLSFSDEVHSRPATANRNVASAFITSRKFIARRSRYL